MREGEAIMLAIISGIAAAAAGAFLFPLLSDWLRKKGIIV